MILLSFWVCNADPFVCYLHQKKKNCLLRLVLTCGEAIIYMMRYTKHTLCNTYLVARCALCPSYIRRIVLYTRYSFHTVFDVQAAVAYKYECWALLAFPPRVVSSAAARIIHTLLLREVRQDLLLPIIVIDHSSLKSPKYVRQLQRFCGIHFRPYSLVSIAMHNNTKLGTLLSR